MIKLNVLAGFMGASSVDDNAMDMFFKSTRYLANTIAAVFNKFVIQQLVDLNFRRGKYPKLRARRIGEWNDLRTLSFAARNFVGAGLITPDDVLEASLREESDLPPMDKATSRVVVGPALQHVPSNPDVFNNPAGSDANTPGAPVPGRAGLPRQTPPSPGRIRGNSGRDTSGG
jgi:hypothetical protein